MSRSFLSHRAFRRIFGFALRLPSGFAYVFNGQNEQSAEDPNFWVWRTGYGADGSVVFTSDRLGCGYLCGEFLDQFEPARRSGTWVVFDRDCSFKAGEGVWIVASNRLTNPRVIVDHRD